jgi:hypothetical protein
VWRISNEPNPVSSFAVDLDAIHQCKARYWRAVDSKNWHLFDEVFTEDGVLDSSEDAVRGGRPAEQGIHRGRTTIVAMLCRMLADATTIHHGHQPEIAFVDTNSATGIWTMEDQIWFPDSFPVRYLHGYGHYHDRYVRGVDNIWRMTHSRLTRVRVDTTLAPSSPT